MKNVKSHCLELIKMMKVSERYEFRRPLLGANNDFHFLEKHEIRRLGGHQSIVFSRISTLLKKNMTFLSDLMKHRGTDTF